MKRLTDAWFEFNGINCADKHVRLMEMPERTRPAMRGESVLVPGKNGDVWISEDAYDIFTVNVDCTTLDDDFDVNEINEWLTGEGGLRFSDEPDIIYHARVSDSFARSNRWLRFADQEFSIPFVCQPMRYKFLADEAADDVEISEPNFSITNEGTVFSEPRITVVGSGDCSITLNAQEITLEGLTDGIIIDSELQDCLSLDGGELLNNLASMDEFPILRVGANNLTYTGNILSITIRPRWRYL